MGRGKASKRSRAPGQLILEIRREGEAVFVNNYEVHDPLAKEILSPTGRVDLASELAQVLHARIPGGRKILQVAGAPLSIARRLAGQVLWVFVAGERPVPGPAHSQNG